MCSGARTGSLRIRSHSEAGRSGARFRGLGHATNLASSSRRTVSTMNPQVVDPGRRLHGHLHAPGRRHDRERRAAVDRAGPRGELRRPAVGDRRLRADAGGAPADRRIAGRPDRPQAGVRDRPRSSSRSPRSGAAWRPRRTRSTSPARCRGSAARSCSPPASRCSPPPTRAADRGTALGLWGATTGAAVAVGPLVGGVLTEWHRVGGDLLRQRADRGDRHRRSPSPASRSPRTRAPGGLDIAGHRHLLGRPVPARVRAHPRQPGGLERRDHRRARRPPCCCSSPSWSWSAAGATRCST